MMTPRKLLLGLTVVALAAGTSLWADEAAESTAETAAAPVEESAAGQQAVVGERASTPPEPLELDPLFQDLLDESEKIDMAGCTAWYACVHGGSVSCSAPTGTCTSSGQGCGLVVCNGQSTFCPGACNGNDWSCARFCHETYGSQDGYCDSLRCCVCL